MSTLHPPPNTTKPPNPPIHKMPLCSVYGVETVVIASLVFEIEELQLKLDG